MRIFGGGQQRYTVKAAGLTIPGAGRARRRNALRPLWPLTFAAGVGLGALALLQQGGIIDSAPAPVVSGQPADLVAAARRMPICGSAKRITCVVDGDTFWIEGEKVRVASIDAPEVNGHCQYERDHARRATERLSAILSAGGIRLVRTGVDRYGRTLALVETNGGEAGAILVREGLAQSWAGRKANWCA